MEEKKVPFLCGGTFFILLTRAKISWGSNRQIRDRAIREMIDGYKADGDNNTYPDMLAGLIQMFEPDFIKPTENRTFDGETTKFRACQVSYSDNLPFNQDCLIDDFDKEIKENYQEKLAEMHTFTTLRLNTGKNKSKTQKGMKWLIQALLMLLWNDKTIKLDQEFYALESGGTITKRDLVQKTDRYCADALLLGIWHYIVTKRPLDNEEGRATFERWNKEPDKESKKAQWTFVSKIGDTYPKEISYYFHGDECAVEESVEEKSIDEPKIEQTQEIKGVVSEDEEQETVEAEFVEAEVVDDIPSGEGKKKRKKKKKKAGRTINQYNVFSGNGPQYGHVDKIEINNYNK